jgi:hypothetical protein
VRKDSPICDGTGKEVLPQEDKTILSLLPLLQEADKRICKTVHSLISKSEIHSSFKIASIK